MKDGPKDLKKWYMVFVLTLGMIVAYIDRILVTLLVDPIKVSLNINDFQFSLLQGFAFIILYAGAGIPLARLADRKSRRLLIACGIIGWSIFTMCCGVAKSYAGFLASRVGVGLGESTLAPAASSMMASSFPARSLAVPVSIFTCGAYLGAGLAFFLAGYLVDTFNRVVPLDLGIVIITEGWRLAFIAAGAIGFVVAALMFSFAEPPRGDRDKPKLPTGTGVFRHLWSGRSVYAPHFLGFSLLMMINQVFYAWIPATLMRTFGVTPAYVGVRLSVIMATCGVAGAMVGGVVADRMFKSGRRNGPILIGMAAGGGLVLLGGSAPLMPTPDSCVAMLVPVVFIMSLPFGAGFGSVQLVAPPEMRAQVSAIYLFTISIIGGAIGPAATAALTDYVFVDPGMVRYSLSIVVAVSGALATVLLMTGSGAFAQAVRHHQDSNEAP